MVRRLRFSVRTLAILVTLVCAYFGAWEATKRWGVRDVALRKDPRLASDEWFENEYLDMARSEGILSSPMPFVVSTEEVVGNGHMAWVTDKRVYCVWFFGVVVESSIRF